MKVRAQQTLLFQGDSITDCGRGRPIGEMTALGDGYTKQVSALLQAGYPDRKIRVLNTGVGGNRVSDLQMRWQTDVLDLKPDWLSIMIGTNDVWRQFDDADNPDQVLPERFEAIYRRLLTKTRHRLKGLILLTPFLIETNPSDPMRVRMTEYGAIVRHLAGEFDASFVDTQARYDDAMISINPAELSDDRVHPTFVGHSVLALGILDALDFRILP